MSHKINHANIKEWAKNYDGEPFDGILCDPPYELGFMGKSWDSSGIAFDTEMWADLFRHIKPGGHLLAFSGSRTYHRMAVAIEDAGFEIRDQLIWMYGSGFPKSLNIGKAVDKIQGNEREDLGASQYANKGRTATHNAMSGEMTDSAQERITKGTSEWEGYGTALKPAHEPCVLARKPIEGTVAQNCLKHGVGGLNIDESRVGMSQEDKEMLDAKASTNNNGVNFDVGESKTKGTATSANNLGRFPANLIHDGSDEVEAVFPSSKGGGFPKTNTNGTSMFGTAGIDKEERVNMGDSGSASRFFMACPPSLKYDSMSVCKHLSANIVAKVLMTIQATEDPTAHSSAVDLQDEQLDQNVRSATKGCEKCVTPIVQELVRIKNWASSPEGLTAFRLYMQNYKNDTLTQNLVSIVEKWVNTDTTPTTTNLLTLFGCVLLATDENTKQASQEKDKGIYRLKYTAKASKSERNAGLEGFELKQSSVNLRQQGGLPAPDKEYLVQNVHPTVKPLSLTKYLATLIKPPTGGRLLVPFSGSGSEMIGALQAGWEYVEGVELTEEYIPIAEARIKYWLEQQGNQLKQTELL